MNINDEWRIVARPREGVAIIGADDGCTYEMDDDRAARLVALWNLTLGIPTRKIRIAKPVKLIPRGQFGCHDCDETFTTGKEFHDHIAACDAKKEA